MIATGREIDKRYSWPLGRAERLARRRKLPHLILPDGSIRFNPDEIDSLIRRAPELPEAAEVKR